MDILLRKDDLFPGSRTKHQPLFQIGWTVDVGWVK